MTASSNAVPNGFKQTDVGVIPEEWDMRPIGRAGAVLGGRQRSPNRAGSLCNYLRVANVFDGYIDTSDVLQMPFTPTEREQFLLQEGDILLNEGQSLELVGRSAIYRGQPANCCFQNTLVRFRAGRDLCTEFAQLVFQQYLRDGVFASIALQTTSIAHLGAGRLARLQMPIPPLAEQEAIAEALGDADAWIESLERLVAKKRSLKQAAMRQLLTGKRRLPGYEGESEFKCTDAGLIPRDWQALPFMEVARIPNGQVDPKHERYRSMVLVAPDHIEAGTGRLLIKRTAADQNAISGKYLFAPGDVIYSKIRPYLRKAILADFEGLCSADMYPMRTAPDVSAGFLLATILGYHFSKYAVSVSVRSGMPKINRSELADYRVATPPTRAEQEAIADVLSDMDAEIEAIEAKLTKARQIKQGMMQELLTGKTRLV